MFPFLAVAAFVGGLAMFSRAGRPDRLQLLLAFLVLTVFIGLRHKVGMDWNNYLRMIARAAAADDYSRLLDVCEPLYALALAIGDWSGFGIYGVNFFASLIIVYGVFQFARTTPEPWLAIMAALPYFMVVFGMSANRQAIAAGILLVLVARWPQISMLKRVLFVFLAAGFHFSALILLMFVGLDVRANVWLKSIALLIFGSIMLYLLQATDQAEYYDKTYVSESAVSESAGALAHVALNSVPAALFFLFSRNQAMRFPNPLMRNLAYAALVTLPLAFILSTAASRISVYWFPVSMWFWAAAPQLFTRAAQPLIRLIICVVMTGLMVGWLSVGNSATAYIPYANALFMEHWELHIGYVPK